MGIRMGCDMYSMYGFGVWIPIGALGLHCEAFIGSHILIF